MLWPEVKQVAMVVLTTPLLYVKLNTQQHWRQHETYTNYSLYNHNVVWCLSTNALYAGKHCRYFICLLWFLCFTYMFWLDRLTETG